MPKGKPLTLAQREHIAELRKDHPMRLVAEITGLSFDTIKRANRSPKARNIKWTIEHAKEWRTLLKKRDENNKPIWNNKMLAEKYGCTPSTIGKKLQEYGV